MQTKQSSASALRSATAWRPLQRVMMPALRALVSVVMLGAGAAQAATFEGTSPSRNSGPYRIPATGTGAVSGAPAESYPLEVNVPESVAQGQVVRGVKVQLNSLIHTWATDLDIMLVAPNGQNVLLLSDAGSSGDLSGNYTFEDAAASTVPVGATIPAGSYKPTNVGAGDNFPFPAPAPSPAVTLSSLNGVAAAGTWRLFIVDDEDVISGSIGSFKLTLQTGFPNGSAITINDAASANPYPSTINVSGLTGTISKVTARVNGLTHTNPTDIDMLLVSPSGQGVRLMSDNGGGDDVAGVNLSFDDAAANSLGVVQIVSGTYKPSNNGANDAFAAPAPTAPYGTTLAAFNGTNPNGEWKLFIVDDSALDTGSLASWSIDIETTPPVISLAPTASVTEGGILSTTITRSVGNGVSTVRVAADDASGTTTALGFFDFSGGPEVTMTFADGEVSKTFNVTTLNDTIDEADEEFRVTIFNPTQATIGNDKTVATIVDNDAPPVLSLQGPTVSESGNLSFAYTLSGPSGLPISFNASTSNGTAVAGSDYTALANAPVTIPVGTTSGTITVPVVNDTQDEANETLTLTLSNPVNVSLPAAPAAVGTILDDDASPDISIGDVTITEGNSGTANASFTILISSPSGQAVSVDYATADGTAASGSDYTSTSGTVVIAPGQTQRTITVPVAGDVEIEGNEAFTVNLSNAVNGNIADGQGVGTITNDDTAQSLPVISINDASVTEGNSATSTNSAVFTVSLSAPSPQPVTFSFATSAGTAALSSDFPNLSGPITIAAGVTSQSIVVPVFGDTVVEANETFFVTLSNVNNATPGDVTGTGTIVNDDAATPAPQVLAVTPGSALRNADVVIVGLNFAGATSVKFNGVAATFIVTSPNRITAKVPATATTGALTITTPAGTTGGGIFTVVIPPTLTAFSPAKAAAGTLVAITGTHLNLVNSVKFNNVPAAFVKVSSTLIRATVPLLATTGKITVTSPSGTATSVAVFQVLPKINSFSPAAGAAGALVTITGSGFSNAVSVKFNNVAAAFTKLSANQIRATVPLAATTGKISVTNAAGTALSLTNFTVLPKLTSFTPASGPIGTVVTITGSGLGTLTGVKFNGVTATGFTKVSATQVKATVPAGATTGKITLLAPTGNILSTTNFTVASAPGA